MRRFGLLALVVPLTALTLAPAAPGSADDPLPAAPVAPVKGLRQPIRGPVKPIRPGVTTETPLLSDAEALKQAGLPADEAGPLLEYLRARTLTDVDQTKIGNIIKKFGADEFDVRVKATEEVERFGPAAIGPLKAAERDADPEVAYRARQALKHMEKVPHSQVSAAAVRAVARLKPKDGAAVLVAFLPMADTEEVAEDIRTALTELAVTEDGKPEPALVAALEDKSVLRRSAAYVALTEGGDPAERVRMPSRWSRRPCATRPTSTPSSAACGRC
jgi:hypothetical protein